MASLSWVKEDNGIVKVWLFTPDRSWRIYPAFFWF
jgi:hypothetical protein